MSWSTGSATTSPSGPDLRPGRDGFLRLAFARRGSRTVLTEHRFTLPLQALGAMDLDGSGDATVMLLNPTGGLLGGDVVDTRVTLATGSRVCLTTAAASRVYRSQGAPAVSRFSAVLEGDAVLEYVPDHLIPSPGARLRQHTEVMLAPESTLILVDAWAVGRIARGERWRFALLDSAIIVRDPGGLLVRERAVLSGARPLEGVGGVEGIGYVATFLALQPSRDSWSELARDLSAAVEALGMNRRAAVTPLGRGGLLARLLAPSAPLLHEAVTALWALTRRRLLGRDAVCLRKL
jgi:urease accessory protein